MNSFQVLLSLRGNYQPVMPVRRKILKKVIRIKTPVSAGLAASFPKGDAMSATATAIDNFEKTVKQHIAKKVGDTKAIIEQIGVVKKATPPVYDEDKVKVFLTQRSKALSCLIDNYLVAKLSSQYPLLDNDIFKMRRHIYVSQGVVIEDSTVPIKGNATHLEVPLFIHGEADSKKKIEVAKYRRSQSVVGTSTTINVTVSVPETPLAVAELGRKALGFYYSTLADVLNDPATSDLFAAEAPPTLETMWIPTAQSLNVKVDVERIPAPRSYDPALLLNHRGRYYLVGLWDIKEELPFENILREFTVKFPKS